MADKVLYFVIDDKDTVVDIIMASDDKDALKQAIKQGEDFTAEKITSKNWKRMAEKFGEIVEGARDYAEFQDQMTRAFQRLGLPPSQIKEAARGRELHARATLNALGLTEKDFDDFKDVDPTEDLSEGSDELSEEQADEALRRTRIKLGLKE